MSCLIFTKQQCQIFYLQFPLIVMVFQTLKITKKIINWAFFILIALIGIKLEIIMHFMFCYKKKSFLFVFCFVFFKNKIAHTRKLAHTQQICFFFGIAFVCLFEMCNEKVAMINPFPIGDKSGLFIPYFWENMPQVLTYNSLMTGIQFTNMFNDSFYRVGYNSLGYC